MSEINSVRRSLNKETKDEWKIMSRIGFNSQKWSKCNFSPEYPYITQQTDNENTQN